MFFFNKPVLAQEQDGLLQLEAQGLRLDKLQRATIHLDQSLSALAISLLLEVSDDSVRTMCTTLVLFSALAFHVPISA